MGSNGNLVVEISSTYRGKNRISTFISILPNMHLLKVREVLLADMETHIVDFNNLLKLF